MIKFFLISLMFISSAFASDVEDAFKQKNFKRISEIYRDQPKRNYTAKELIYISYSLRQMGFYRQDIKLNIRLINKKYLSYHKKLLKDVKNGETIDGEEYPNALKVLYWNLMNDFGRILEGYEESSELIKKDHDHYLIFSKLLSELEYREGTVDKLNDRILAHLQSLENKIYRFSNSMSIQYISWQTEPSLVGPKGETKLIVTNSGVCFGGDLGVENAYYHFYLDGCAFVGSGSVASDSSALDKYKQTNVTAYGFKGGLGASMIVSSSGSRIGLRLPIIFTIQKPQEPENKSYKIKEDEPISFATTLYSRWQFDTWYFQTEFGKYIQAEQTFWGLGIGKNF
jgi:hypothetical protein